MRIEPNAKCQRVLVLVVAVARKRGEKSDAARASSSVSSFVVRQQTKQGLWLQLRVTLASYSASSGQFVLCLSHVVGCEPITDHGAAVASSVADYTTLLLSDRHRRTLSLKASLSQTANSDEMLLPAAKLQSSTAAEHYASRSASQPAESTPLLLDGLSESKMSLCWTNADLYLAWAGSSETAADRACHWQRSDRRRHSCEADEWSAPCRQRVTDDDFVGYQDVDNGCTQLQQLLNCDSSSYDVTSAHSTRQSAPPVDVVYRNVYEN